MSNWDNDQSLSFIKEYEKRSILWNKSDKLYYNTSKKENAWREISVILDKDIAVLKKKIECLRGAWRREKHRALQSKETGKRRRRSHWFAWDALQFLEDPQSNYSEKEDVVTEEELYEALKWNTNQYDESKESKNILLCDDQPEKKNQSFESNMPKIKHSEDSRIKKTPNILQSTDEIDTKKDECSIFGTYIAEKLRKHDSRTRIILQHKMHSLLFQAEMNIQEFLAPFTQQAQLPTESQTMSTSS